MRHDVDDDDDRILADGERIRVPLHLRDGMQRAVALHYHQPGYRTTADAAALDARRQARDEYLARLALWDVFVGGPVHQP